MTDKKTTITAEQVANYAVCPEAWRLKYAGKGKKRKTDRTERGRQLRKAWVDSYDASFTLRSYAKIVYLMLVVVVIIVFLLEHQRAQNENQRKRDAAQAIEGAP